MASTTTSAAGTIRLPIPPTKNPYGAAAAPRRKPKEPKREKPPDKDEDPVAYALYEIRQAMNAKMQRVTDLFRIFDKNGDSTVSRSEFRQCLPLLDLPYYGSEQMVSAQEE